MHSLYLPQADAFIRWHALPGTGAPVIWLPGISFPAVGNFLATATDPALAGRAAIMIDFLGTGVSDHPTAFDHTLPAHAGCVAAVLDALGLAACPAVGYSMGGSIAIELADSRPDLVSRLLVAEANLRSGGGQVSRHFASFGADIFASQVLPEVIADLRAGAVAGNPVDAFIHAAMTRVQPAALHCMSRMLVGIGPDFIDRFLALTCPRSFVYGEENYPVTPDAAADAPDPGRLRAGGVQTAILPGTGHEMMLANPAGFADIVARWLAA